MPCCVQNKPLLETIGLLAGAILITTATDEYRQIAEHEGRKGLCTMIRGFMTSRAILGQLESIRAAVLLHVIWRACSYKQSQ
jgi:hypothetical protein